MANFSQYLTPAIAAVATAASLASVTISEPPPQQAAAAPALNTLTDAEKKDGWTLLFDGTSLKGWRGYKQKDADGTRWKVESGMLTIDPADGKDTRGALDIISADTYDRFDLTWEWRVSEGGNSGLKYFILEDLPSAIGHEYQMIDDERHADAKIGPHRQTSAFYDVLAAQQPRPIKPAGEWNTSRVRVAPSRVVPGGTRVYHDLNDVRVLEYELDSPELRAAIAKSKFKDVARFGKLQNGNILLQDHGDRVWYRNVKIKRLAATPKTGTEVVANEAARRVDISIDGEPFTSYIYPEDQKKPVLFPINTAKGTPVTRGYPLAPRAGERVDHPHHIGLWFNHGDVNGLDFWNNDKSLSAARAAKMGTIRHTRIVHARGGADGGDLAVEMEWVDPNGVALLREQARYLFRGSGNNRSIDRITTLTALDKPVTFRDNKEGLIGLRVARTLEQPVDKPELYTDANGKPKKTPDVDNTGVAGQYLSSEGLKGDAVWGTRGRWCILTGTVGVEPVTVAILDHPGNPNAPTYWHARGYGLFAANGLGRQVFDKSQTELVLTLEPGKSVTYRYRVLVTGGTAAADAIEREYRTFSATASSAK